MPEKYDTQQVCENGHQVTGCCTIHPERQKKFCQECGAATISVCPSCSEKIQGNPLEVRRSWEACNGQRVVSGRSVGVPAYCSNCGEPYPWTKNKIAVAIQMFAEFSDLDEEEKRTIEQDINNVAKDTPETKLSVMRIKRLWEKYGKATYDVIMEFASKTAAEVLKDQ